MKRSIAPVLVAMLIIAGCFLARKAIIKSDVPEHVKFYMLTDWEKAKWISGWRP
nr:MAG TPA: foot protein [Caudoviricetes sp.]